MTRRRWTEEEDRIVRERYATSHTPALATELGRSEKSVYQRAIGQGLKKSADYLASDEAARFRRGVCRSPDTAFKPGHTTWNKGKHWVAGGRSAETRFKKGVKPNTYAPIGSERVTKDGILQRKVTDHLGTPRDWRAVHTLLWEEHNGPLPSGHLVIFKDGNRQNITIENLEALSRSENMKRNSYHTRYPKEIAKLIQLRGALNRQINKRENSNEEQD